MEKETVPPKVFLRLFRWFCHPSLLSSIEGDLMELYRERVRLSGKRKADWKFGLDVLLLFRPGIIRPTDGFYQLNNYGMIKSYLKIGWRNLMRDKGYSLINIGGLAAGMAVAILIGLWIHDEFTFDRGHKNYNQIAQVMQNATINGIIDTSPALPTPLANELRTTFGDDFKHVVLSSWTEGHVLSVGDVKLWKVGNYIEDEAPEMLSLKIVQGSKDGLKDPYSIMIRESVATAFFGDENAVNKIMLLDNHLAVKVTGVFEDLPYNSRFNNVDFLVPWKLNVAIRDWVKDSQSNWTNNSFQIFAQIADHADMEQVSQKIKDAKLNKINRDTDRTKPEIFLQPMSRWHLHSEFKNGRNAGGRIQFVWLFGVIGVFVLLLACINFMNLSTARSEKRAKEVGIRKAIGSVQSQLIVQFLSESLLTVFLAFFISLLVVVLILPAFNEVSDKHISMLWNQPVFWLACTGFSIITGLIAGSYPALYLSSFQPVKVLKGALVRAGRIASLPRKVLVVAQFSVSIILIIGTVVVFQQIQFAKNRPIGYTRDGLISIQTMSGDIHNHYDAVREDLINSGAVVETGESESPLTGVWNINGGFGWSGKDPNQQADFAVIGVSHGFGKTVGWEFIEGRDFSKDFPSDSSGMVVNETAVKFMGLKNPIGEEITEPYPGGVLKYKIVGVIKDMIMTSPYEPAQQTLFYLGNGPSNFINIRINPAMSASEAISKIGAIYLKHSPSSLFDYKFADQEFAKKFAAESRVGELATFFAALAIFISCLGLFGLASYVAEQRTKEIGIRKVMGASVTSLWQMLSKDFVVLVIVSFIIASPLAWYFMSQWLQQYQFRTEISPWVFLITGLGAFAITLMTVSFHAIRAATINPVKSLRTE